MSSQHGLSQGPVPYKIVGAIKPSSSAGYSVDSLYRWVEDGSININPEYQRSVVWSEEKQAGLIDSLMRNFHLPPLIFARQTDDEGFTTRICIDGKQRLTSIQNFLNGVFSLLSALDPNPSYPRDKYWYTKPDGKPGHELPRRFKDDFLSKQVVCIEYEDLNDKQQREIFRRVQLGVALNAAEKMKALDITPKTKLVQELVGDHAATLQDINFTVKRTQDFRWFAASLFTLHRSQREHVPLSVAGPKTVEKWLTEEDSEPQEHWDEFSKQFSSAVDLLINIVTSNRHALYVHKPPMTVAPLDLVAMIHLVYRFRSRFSEDVLAKAIRCMRNLARDRLKDIRWNSSCIAVYSDFLEKFSTNGLDLLKDEEELEEEEDELDEDEEEYVPPQPSARPPPSTPASTSASTFTRPPASTSSRPPVSMSSLPPATTYSRPPASTSSHPPASQAARTPALQSTRTPDSQTSEPPGPRTPRSMKHRSISLPHGRSLPTARTPSRSPEKRATASQSNSAAPIQTLHGAQQPTPTPSASSAASSSQPEQTSMERDPSSGLTIEQFDALPAQQRWSLIQQQHQQREGSSSGGMKRLSPYESQLSEPRKKSRS